jgi:hypothetical protein
MKSRAELETLVAAAESACAGPGGGWWHLTHLALRAALWASRRAERATGASLADAVRVMESV